MVLKGSTQRVSSKANFSHMLLLIKYHITKQGNLADLDSQSICRIPLSLKLYRVPVQTKYSESRVGP